MAIRWAIESWIAFFFGKLFGTVSKRLWLVKKKKNAKPVEKQLLKEFQEDINNAAISEEVIKIYQFLSPIQKEVVDDLNNLNAIALNRFRAKGSEHSDDDNVDDDGDCEISKAFPKLPAIKSFKYLYSMQLFPEK